ncbi:NAD-dependent epimerase/dehydratase family protein [Chloroflexota bacterium]
MSRILITGGAGFIGYHLAKRLSEQNHTVIICDNFLRGKLDNDLQDLLEKYDNCELVNCDLANKEGLKNLGGSYNYVYHLAALMSVKYATEMPEKVLRDNVLSTINILDWFLESKSGRILFSSTSETYSAAIEHYTLPIPTPEDVPLIIDDAFNPRYSYKASKILGELLFINYARAHNINMSIMRYHNIYGPRMGFEHVISELSMRILNQENPFKLYSPNQSRAFCYVEDAVDATIKVAESEKASSEIINIGNDAEEISISTLASKLFKVAGFFPEVEPLPSPPGSPDRRCPAINKLRDVTGFKPKIALDEGLPRTFEWYRKHYEETGYGKGKGV